MVWTEPEVAEKERVGSAQTIAVEIQQTQAT